MRISEISIRRPVLATVMNLIIILMGLVAWDRLQLREYPNIDVPTISVATFWRGASAEIMETQVTKILEDSISGIEGIDFISSTTRAEQSNINITFKLNRNPDDAAADVRDRVGRVRDQLPREVDEPLIAKTQADATPIIYLALASATVDEMEVTDVADRVVQDRLQTLPGIASVEIYGARKFAMRVWLNASKLAAFQLTPEDVSNALLSQNVEVPGGRIEGPDREFTVLTETDLKTPEQFKAIVLRETPDYLVRLGDVATVELGPEDTRVVARHNNRPAVALGIVKQSTANPLDVSREVQGAMAQINAMLPQGIELTVAYDSTVFIDASIKAVYRTILEAIGFVAIVIFFFLRSVRASVIPLITIPISLLGALVLMLALGFSLNTLTLLAFVLAIGLVVDDAIVMLENISRYVDEGMKPFDAALKGSKEIGFAVIAMTLTLAAVFAPIGMAEGRTGKLFTEFALALAGAVLVSGFIALTLTPMLCAKLLKSGKHTLPQPMITRAHNWAQREIDMPVSVPRRIVARLVRKVVSPLDFSLYPQRLAAVLASPRRTIRLTLGSLAVTMVLLFGGVTLFNTATFGVFREGTTSFQQLISGFKQMAAGELQGPPPPAVMQILESNSWTIPLYFITAKPLNLLLSGLPKELSPTEDRGFFVGVGFAPEGSTIDYTTRYAMMVEKIYDTIPERHMHFVVTGFPVVSQMLSFVVMKDWSERNRSVFNIASTEVQPQLFGVPGLLAFAGNPPSLGQDFLDADVTFILQTTGNWQQLNMVAQELLTRASQNPGLQNMRFDIDMNKPELRISLNRDKVAAVGVNVAEVGNTLELMLGGRQVTRFKRDGEQYDVILQLDDADRREPADLTGIFVRNNKGEMIQLANLVDIVETVTPKELNHFNKLRSATYTASLSPGYSLGEALTFLNQTLVDINAPNVTADYGAGSREFMQSSGAILFVFILALVFIYLVLAAQFESFIDPFIILITVPMAAFGALVALTATGNSINIYSQIGLITLVGLIAKNGILIVEFANQLQEQGYDKLRAVSEAAALRLRPILMTTAATVLGAMPLAFATGAGAEARQVIGWVIVGGMTIGTMFTLFVIPVVYMWIGQVKQPHAEGLTA
jgi:multidrug efflux pump